MPAVRRALPAGLLAVLLVAGCATTAPPTAGPAPGADGNGWRYALVIDASSSVCELDGSQVVALVTRQKVSIWPLVAMSGSAK